MTVPPLRRRADRARHRRGRRARRRRRQHRPGRRRRRWHRHRLPAHQRQQDRRQHRRDGPADRHQLVRHGDRQQDLPRAVVEQPVARAARHDGPAGLQHDAGAVLDDALKPGATASGINDFVNPDLVGLSPLQILDKVIAYAGSKGMRIILDRHRPTAAGQSRALVHPDGLRGDLDHRLEDAGPAVRGQPHGDRRGPAQRAARRGHRTRRPPARAGAAATPPGTGGWPPSGPATRSSACQPNWLIFVEGVSCPQRRPLQRLGQRSQQRRGLRLVGRQPVQGRAVPGPAERGQPAGLLAARVRHLGLPADLVRRPRLPGEPAGHLGQVLGLPVQAEHRPDHDRRVRQHPGRPAGQGVAGEADGVHRHRGQRDVLHLLVVEPELG